MRSCAISNLVVMVGLGALVGFAACESQKPAAPVTLVPSAEATAAAASEAAASQRPNPQAAPGDFVGALDRELIQLESCGQLSCATFSEPKDALSALLAANPAILAVGEAHVMKGKDGVRSSTERFQQELLPTLASYGSSELVVELLKPAPQCEKQVETVKQQEKQVTEKQSSGNKDRFVSLGIASRELGVVPYLLEPACPAYQEIASAGEEAVLKMLEVISRETERRVSQFYERQEQRRKSGEVPKLVVTYGGALHNDVEVEAGKESFSFGKDLIELSGGRYLELDLIVPEFIQDNEVWRKLPWFASFDRSTPRRESTLIRTGPRSFVLIFPHSVAGTGDATGESTASPSPSGAATTP